jgi:hypothetical protein
MKRRETVRMHVRSASPDALFLAIPHGKTDKSREALIVRRGRKQMRPSEFTYIWGNYRIGDAFIGEDHTDIAWC